jgi:hypothetical protein
LILEQELDNLASDPTKLFNYELFEQNSDECLDLELLINNESIIIRDTQRYGNMVYVWSCDDDIQLEMVDFISIRIPKSSPLSNMLQHFPPNTSLVTQNGLKVSTFQFQIHSLPDICIFVVSKDFT